MSDWEDFLSCDQICGLPLLRFELMNKIFINRYGSGSAEFVTYLITYPDLELSIRILINTLVWKKSNFFLYINFAISASTSWILLSVLDQISNTDTVIQNPECFFDKHPPNGSRRTKLLEKFFDILTCRNKASAISNFSDGFFKLFRHFTIPSSNFLYWIGM